VIAASLNARCKRLDPLYAERPCEFVSTGGVKHRLAGARGAGAIGTGFVKEFGERDGQALADDKTVRKINDLPRQVSDWFQLKK